MSDGPYYYFTARPWGPCITGHNRTGQAGKKNKEKWQGRRVKNTTLDFLPLQLTGSALSHSLGMCCMLAITSLMCMCVCVCADYSIDVWNMNASHSIRCIPIFHALSWFKASQSYKVNQIHLYLIIIYQCYILYSACSKQMIYTIFCDFMQGEQITSSLWGVKLWHWSVSLMWLGTFQQAIKNIDPSLSTAESIICAWSASQKMW